MQTIQELLSLAPPPAETRGTQPQTSTTSHADETSEQRILRWIAEAGMQEIPAFTQKAVAYFRERDKGLFVVGPSGCGKTTMMRILADRLKIPMVRARELPRIVSSMCRKRDDLHGFKSACNTEPHDVPGNRFAYDFIVDDLGKEPTETTSFGSRQNIMQEVIEERYDFWKEGHGCTSFTTELAYRQLRDAYPAHIMNRIEEMCVIVKMDKVMRPKWIPEK